MSDPKEVADLVARINFARLYLSTIGGSDAFAAEQLLSELEPTLQSPSADLERVTSERDAARQIVRDIHWMAHRYVDGRMTYAVGMFNDAVKKAYDAGWLVHPEGSPERQYALDGMSPEWKSLEARISTLTEALGETRLILASIVGCDDGKPGLRDCTDNDGKPYQSQYLADMLAVARALPSHKKQGEAP